MRPTASQPGSQPLTERNPEMKFPDELESRGGGKWGKDTDADGDGEYPWLQS